MAKAKAKSAHARLVHAFKKNIIGTWNRNAADLAERINRAREGGPLDQAFGYPILADSVLTNQEAVHYGDLYEEMYGKKSKAPHFPDAIAAWERNPKYIELSPDAIFQFNFSEEKSKEALIDRLNDFFPGCLLIDTSGIEWECGYYGDLISAVFVYPTFDEEKGLPLLRYIGLANGGIRGAFFANLLLSGNTVGEARRYTEAESKRRFALMMTDEEEREAYESLRDLFEEIDMTQEDLSVLVDRLLGLMLLGVLVPEELGFDGDVRCIRLISKYEAEEKAKRKELAGRFLLNEEAAASVASADAVSDEPGAGEEEGKAAEETNSVLDESAISALQEEALALRSALVQSGEQYEQLRARTESEKAAFLHHLHEVESRCRKLEERVAALGQRAALIDELEVPKTTLDALMLARKAYPDKLLFLDQAVDSAAEFDGRPVNEVWTLLRSMATVLHPLVFERQEGAKGDIEELYQSQSGFEIALRDVKQLKRNPKYMKKRTISFEGRNYDMSSHVKGRSNKPGEALRVHFFVDYDRRLIVIGHCGDHLPAWW